MRLPVLRLLCLFLLCFASCKTPKEKPPIPYQEMKEVMLDIHLAETYSQGLGDTTGNKFDKNYDSLAVFYASILKHHNLTLTAFNDALDWYRKRPLQMDSLYSGVLDLLNTLKAKEGIRDIDDNSNTPVSRPVPDSLKKNGPLKDTTGKQQKTDTQASESRRKPTTQAEP